MPIGKAEDALNLALDVSETTREKSSNLGVGYFPATNTWELIVKYSGSLDRIREELNISAVELFDEYAIIIIPENLINTLAQYEEIEFIEKPKRIS
ncbi:MAG TPA: peptidase S8, partial [Lachnospiraceae bacterium]|nr:peptidase S8 [Lachnospiraceae bacterium]